MKARISPVIRNIPIHYGDDTIQSDMGESSSSDSESEDDEYEAMRLRRANMRTERDRNERAPERDILEDDTETAEFQTRLRKLSSSSSVSQQLNCSGSALPELSRPAKSASGDLIEEEDEAMFADTTEEMKEISIDVSMKEEPTIAPHCPKPTHPPPILAAHAIKQDQPSILESTLPNKHVSNVTQSEEEALDRVTNADLKLPSLKHEDERPHSVAVITSDSEGIVERFNSTYLLPDTRKDEELDQDEIKGSGDKENTEPLEEDEEDEFLKLRSHLIALRHSRSFDSGLSISKLYQQALLANNKELRKGKYYSVDLRGSMI